MHLLLYFGQLQHLTLTSKDVCKNLPENLQI